MKNKVGLIVSLAVPFLFMVIFFIISQSIKPSILWSVYGDRIKISGFDYFTNSYPVFITFAICPISMLCIPNMNIEFRNSLLLKNMKANAISKFQYIGILFSYFLIVSLISSLITTTIFLLFLINNYEFIADFNWLSISFGIFSLIIVSIAFSLFFSTFIKSSIGAQLLGLSVIMLSLVLCGRMMNIQMISKIKSIKYINLFISPIGSSQNSICMGTLRAFWGDYKGQIIHSTNNVFDWNRPHYYFGWKTVERHLVDLPNLPENVKYPVYQKPYFIYNSWEKIFDVLMPYVHATIYFTLSLHFFKWSNR